MSADKTTPSSCPPQSPRLRLSAHAKVVLRGRYLAKNSSGTIIETPTQLFWRVATDIAKADRLYSAASRLPHSAKRWYDCMARLDFLPNSPHPDECPTTPSATFRLFRPPGRRLPVFHL